MKTQEITVYKEIQKNTEMGMKAIDTISDKVHDEELATQIAREAVKYSEIHTEATKQLVASKAETYKGSFFQDMMLKMGIHCNTMFNTSTGHIAELMIKGSNNGILEMEKILHHNREADEKSVALARQLIDFEENNIKRLKDYL